MLQLLLIFMLLVGGCTGETEVPPTSPGPAAVPGTGPEAELEVEPEVEQETTPATEPMVEETGHPDTTGTALGLCAKISGFAEKHSCITKVAGAVALRDAPGATTICQGSGDKDGCYQVIAPVIASSDPGEAKRMCSEITSQYQDVCYSGVAEAAEDATVCEDASSKDMCYGAVGPLLGKAKGMEACSKTGTFAADACYAELAAKVAETSQSDALSICEATTADNCYPLVAPVIAADDAAKAKELCSKVSTMLQDNCYAELVPITKDESICDLMMSTDRCYSAIAPSLPREDGLGYCARISNFADREGCIESVAKEVAPRSPTEAIAICDEMSEDKNTCYQVIAPVIASSDPGEAKRMCSEITSQYQDVCYSGVAEAAEDATVCEDASSKDMCYSAVAPMVV